MTKIEYLVKRDLSSDELNELGAEGWDLFDIRQQKTRDIDNPYRVIYTFKRTVAT